ncbi:MAG: hypothetical protein IKV00_07840 [Clostridia bacterium]|nr:hypothetical protein [Clostridia bacterium]
MINALKIIVVLLLLLVMAYPILPLPSKAKRFSTFHALRYNAPHNKKNLIFVFLTIFEFVLVAALFKTISNLAATVQAIPLLGPLFSSIVGGFTSGIDFGLFAIRLILVNLVLLYSFVFLKAFVKRLILDPVFGLKVKQSLKGRMQAKRQARQERRMNRKSKKKNKNNDQGADDPMLLEEEKKKSKSEEERLAEEEERRRKRNRIPLFIHSNESDDPKPTEGEDDPSEEGKGKKRQMPSALEGIWASIAGVFFEGDEYQYARPWVVRVRMVLQAFIYLVEVLYFILFALVIAALFFPLPTAVTTLLIDVLHIQDWYVYPFISIIFLQEICNVFRAPVPMPLLDEEEKEEEKKIDVKAREARLRALQSELKKRFDKEHALRYYPESIPQEPAEYVCTNRPYASALSYIKKYMKDTTGRVVQSYMEWLDAIYNEDHTYFAASFYSELGEYLIAYTYIRLLAGGRMIFIVSDPGERESLRHHISNRLMAMTGSSPSATWRVYTAEERLDQADVLIACAADFRDDNIVEQFPGFFEEVSNAIFVNADKTVALDSYLCPIMARRLQKATDNRIRFIFLSLDLLKGFAAAVLPKFFSVERVLSFSSAKENEAVAYTLWNRESKKNRIYNKDGQKLAALESLIAEQACLYGVDGVRLITGSPMDHADRKLLALHNVEINNLYRTVSDVNYMIYSDERCNLAAAMYACTRFRGKKSSIVHILSKPYLLREYFMSKAATEDYINRSSFIQPRVTEHAERHRLSLLRIFCDASSESGIRVTEFEDRMRDSIFLARERGDIVTSQYCREKMKGDIASFTKDELAAYMVAGLYDDFETPAADSIAHKAKDFYLIVDPAKNDGYTLMRERYITFRRVKDIFNRLFECNRRVELRLNDERVGMLDTFPSRVHMEYIAGQSIIYNNTEYEIEHISDDGKTMFLRRENINFKNCLDTFLLRRYEIDSLEQIGETGVLHNSQSVLEEIRVTKFRTKFTGETYGFYSLMTDRQTLDFYRGVEGNPHVSKKNVRTYKEGRLLRVELNARMECNDGMRLLIAALFNEFIKTIFPAAYKCIAICPILEEPIPFSEDNEPKSEIDLIRALYPYIKNAQGEFVETDKNRVQFVLLNDCKEDIGALDWFYDRSARYMQEFLANIYSYLYWLKSHPEKNHYIYFGGKALPECYDVEGSCQLLGDLNLVLSDQGKRDIETAGDDPEPEETERCSFCHRMMESGRFSRFDSHRYICADCSDVVDEKEQIEALYDEIRGYLKKTYPEITFAWASADLDPTYDLKEGQELSEYYYRLDKATRIVFAERDIPEVNAKVAILRGLIELWQSDNDRMISYAPAQLYYEELCYLRSLGLNESADWIYAALSESLRAKVDEIKAFVEEPAQNETPAGNPTGVPADEPSDDPVEDPTDEPTDEPTDDPAENPSEEPEEDPKPAPAEAGRRTSFLFMNQKAASIDKKDDPDPEEGEEGSDGLYDPNKMPRFWKRYLLGDRLDNGEEEPSGDAKLTDGDEDPEEEEDPIEGEQDEEEVGMIDLDNAPLDDPATDVEEDPLDDPDEDPTEDPEEDPLDDPIYEPVSEKDRKRAEKQRAKEEKKRAKEEKKRLKAEEKQRRKDEKKNKKSGDVPEVDPSDDPSAESEETTKKRAGGLFRRKPKEDPTPTPEEDPTGEKDEDPTEKKEKDPSAKKSKEKKSKADKKKYSKISEEEEEKNNPRLRLYNEMARAAFAYSEDWMARGDVSDQDLNRIFTFVKQDYPEIFWLKSYTYTPTHVKLGYRCTTPDGKLDVKQIKQKIKELRKAAKEFTKGITRKTPPYEAFLTIYRRLILTLDYDGVGLNAKVDEDVSRDDILRSLHSALVEHKVVCAGYAVALQYLLQSVGITCGYVSSERAEGSGHAFNIVKIGKCCYYVDATWGDSSNTLTGDKDKDNVSYDYCCVPYDEFIKTAPKQEPFHIPNKETYPFLETFQYTNHEYFRYHNAYLCRYDERELVRIFKEAALAYVEKEMGDFTVAFRCESVELLGYIQKILQTGGYHKILKEAKEALASEGKNKKAAQLLDRELNGIYFRDTTGTAYFRYKSPAKKKQKSGKKEK